MPSLDYDRNLTPEQIAATGLTPDQVRRDRAMVGSTESAAPPSRMSGPNYTDAERDLAVRIMAEEAGDQGPNGLAGVANVMRNRLDSGNFGGSLKRVLTTPYAFEPYMTKRGRIMSYTGEEPVYKLGAAIFDGVMHDDIEDNTGGATHFYSPTAQAAFGRNKPQWSRGMPTAAIGGHVFYAPEGKVQRVSDNFDPEEVINRFSAKPADESFDPEAVIKQFSAQPAAQPQAAPASRMVAPENVPLGMRQNPQTGNFEIDPNRPAAQAPPTMGEKIGNAISSVPGNVASAVGQDFSSANALFRQGMQDVVRNKSATGVGNVGLGLLGMAGSPLTGAIKELVEKPAAGVGGPEFGQKAGMLVPGTPIMKAARAAVPAVRAANTIAAAIPDAEVSNVLRRMEANPSLSPMDVSEPLRTMGKGLAASPEAPVAQTVMRNAYEARKAAEKPSRAAAVGGTLGTTPEPLEVLDAIQARAQETGRNVIEPVVRSAGNADVTNVVREIDKELAKNPALANSPYQQRLAQLRDELHGVPDQKELAEGSASAYVGVGGEQGLHATQSRLRAEAQNLLNSSSGAERNLGQKLMDMRGKLVDAIDETTGGKYKPALSQYRDAMQVRDAFDFGNSLERYRQGEAGIREDSAEAWRRWTKDASPDELDAARLGALATIKRRIEGFRSGTSLDSIAQVENTKQKLSALFGKDKADRFMGLMEDEQAKSITNRELFGGSQTASRLEGANALRVREVGKPSSSAALLPTLMTMGGLALETTLPGASIGGLALAGGTAATRAVSHLVQRIARQSDISRNAEIARIISASGNSPERNAFMTLLRQREAASGGNKVQNLLSAPFSQALPR